MTKQWDKFREIIIAEYRDQNKPLHEVRRLMMEKHGFRASTRAYRSRFDRWRIHKYSRRRGHGSANPSRQDKVSGDNGGSGGADDDAQPSPRQSPDLDDGGSPPATPYPSTSSELFPAEMRTAIPIGAFRRPDLVPYTPITPSPRPAVAHGQAFTLDQYEFTPFSSQPPPISYYPSHPFAMYGQAPRHDILGSPSIPGSDKSRTSVSGYSSGPEYPPDISMGQE
ncbi:hypothetical protein VTH82DRAFT_7282 [Thermothelomyces myriococcoides]